MFEHLLSRLTGGLTGAAGDALSGAAFDVLVEQYLAPFATQMRAQLLAQLTGIPPRTFADELRGVGLVVTDAQAELLWGATFRAIANDLPGEKPNWLASLATDPEPVQP
jgi:hypothetical protein